VFVGMCTIDYYKDIEASEKKQDTNDKYNENDDKEWTFVSIYEEIIDECDVKIKNKEFCASAVAPLALLPYRRIGSLILELLPISQ
jgi:hypothetical protein